MSLEIGEAHRRSLSHLKLDLASIAIVVDAAASPGLLGWLARRGGLCAVMSHRDPGMVYKTLDPITGEITWLNERNHFGIGIEIAAPERHPRLRPLLDGTGATPDRMVVLLLPDVEPFSFLERLLEERHILPQTHNLRIRLGIDLLVPGGIQLIRVDRGLGGRTD